MHYLTIKYFSSPYKKINKKCMKNLLKCQETILEEDDDLTLFFIARKQ